MFIKNWFSNMILFEDPLFHNGIKYRSVENFYQAQKSLDPEDHKQIAAVTPFKAKKLGRKLTVRDDWNDETKFAIMRLALKHKFRLDTKQGQKLLDTGDEEIVEWNNWGDKYWGKTVKDGKGENHLGKLLMEVRNELKMKKISNE